MKKIFYVILAFVCLSVSLTSCEALFDNLEGDLTKMTGEDMASSEAGIQMLLAQVYSNLPINAFGIEDIYTMNATNSHGGDDSFVTDPYYGMYGINKYWSWSGIRTINTFIQIAQNAADKGIITAANAKQYIAEARFVRAYCYFVMVRSLGGVPIITEPLDSYYDGVGNEQLFQFATRATEKETWDFVLAECEAAAADLAENAPSDYRASKYAALGLEVRAALYAASVSKYWDKQGAIGNNYKAVASKKTYMEKSYASEYYNKCISAAEAIINSGKFSLYGANPANVEEAVANLGEMFVKRQSCEFIFGRGYNDGNLTSGIDYDVRYSPMQTVSGENVCGRMSVTIDFVDKFDNYDSNFGAVDGTIKTRKDGKENEYFNAVLERFPRERKGIDYIEYDNISDPFQNKDARFQAWILYPDANFRGETIKIQGGLIKTNGDVTLWQDDSETVNGVTYYSFGGPRGKISGFDNYENKKSGNSITTGFGLRKFLDPKSYQLYLKTFWYDIRFSEILLSYAEAVVENNVTAKSAQAEKYLNDIRHRAAYKDNVKLSVDEVLHQRELELAFEGDQLYTLHRRRAFYNQKTDPEVEGSKHALTPVLTLENGTPKYIFVRSIFYAEDVQTGGRSVNYHTDYIQYYSKISDYGVNKYEPNPADE